MTRDPYRYFRVEARELLDQLGHGMLELERQGSPELVARLLRHAHTLKGAARVVKQKEMADRLHAIEDLLAPRRDASDPPPPELVSSVLALLDQVNEQLRNLGAEPTTSAVKPVEEPRSLRTQVAEMDSLLDELSEAHTQVGALRRNVQRVEPIRQLAEVLSEQRDPARIHSLTEDLRTQLGQLERQLTFGVDQLERDLRQVRETTEKLRLVPVETLFTALRRMARDSALELGKRVELVSRGGDVRLDAAVLATVQGALLQAVGNSVAHGLESESERLAAGKRPEGRIDIQVNRQANRVTFVLSDDGRGLDLEAVRAAAEKRGMSPAQTRNLTAEELIGLLLGGGLTTSSRVNLVAGRGVGLDVVREATERLGGEVLLRSEPGHSTTLVLRVPVTLAALQALQVESGGTAALLPLEYVRHTLRLPDERVARTPEGDTVLHEGRVLPFLPLGRALGQASDSTAWTAVLVEASTGWLALGVERLAGIVGAVLRPLPELAPASPVVAGVALDAAGDPLLVLDPDGLLALALKAAPRTAESGTRPAPILVIDDSLTTRMLEQSILESAGFEVELAASAEEALEMARRTRYSLFLVDVEMPGMDGFTFIETTRRDPELARIPALLVTSRKAPEDLARGVAVGAKGHIVKSEFEQKDLLARIGKLLS